jgi:REP element-mobilizing transposase RayT
MPRPLRIHVPGAFYHVTLRGNHRQDIFFSPQDRALFCELLDEVNARFNARLHAYCLMTNHVHLLTQVADVPLGRLMLRVASRYARTVQKRFKTTGHLFERRYHAILVDADEYLLKLVRYIHLNPVRARMVERVDDYPWSSHHAYTGRSPQPGVTTDFVLRLFHSQRQQAIAEYQRFINSQSGIDAPSPLLERNPNDLRVLGDDQFAATMLDAAWRPRSRKTLDEVIQEACERFGVTRQALQSASRRRSLTYTRAWVAHQATSLRITSLAQVARSFGRNEASLRESVRLHFPVDASS